LEIQVHIVTRFTLWSFREPMLGGKHLKSNVSSAATKAATPPGFHIPTTEDGFISGNVGNRGTYSYPYLSFKAVCPSTILLQHPQPVAGQVLGFRARFVYRQKSFWASTVFTEECNFSPRDDPYLITSYGSPTLLFPNIPTATDE